MMKSLINKLLTKVLIGKKIFKWQNNKFYKVNKAKNLALVIFNLKN